MNDKKYSIDWIKGTSTCFPLNDFGFPNFDGINFFNGLLKVLGLNKNFHDYEVKNRGKNGYHKTINIEYGIDLCFDSLSNRNVYGEETCCLEITGQGCDFFKNKHQWYLLLDYLLANKFKFTRVDPCIDDFYCKEFTLHDIRQVVVNGDYKLKQGSKRKPREFKEAEDDSAVEGYTLYIYSDTSEVNVRIYNKSAERKDKVNYLVDTPYWVRYEMELKEENADRFVRSLYVALCKDLDNENTIPKIISAYLNSLFCPIVNDGTVNRSRWPVDPRWEAFIGDISDVTFDRKIIKKSSIDSVKDYMENNYNKPLAKIYLTKGKKFFEAWVNFVAQKGISSIDDEMLNEVNFKRDKIGLSKLSKTDVMEISLADYLNYDEKQILSMWESTEEEAIDKYKSRRFIFESQEKKDNMLSSYEDLINTLIFNLDFEQFKNGVFKLNTSDNRELIEKINKYMEKNYE